MSETIAGNTKSVKQMLIEKIHNRTARIGVVGWGYVGLPFAVEKAKVGFTVTGIEQNPQRAAVWKNKSTNAKSHTISPSSDELSLDQLTQAGATMP